MNITWMLIIIHSILLSKTNEKYGVVKYKIQYLNYLALFVLVLITGYSINATIIAILNYENLDTFFKNYLYMPQWLSIIMFIIEQIASLTSLLLTFFVMQRSNKARIYLLKILPILCIGFTYDFVRRLYETLLTTSAPLYIQIGMIFILAILPFILIYYFYSRKDTEEKIFLNQSITSNKS